MIDGSKANGRSIRVVVVDDDAFVAASLATILSAEPDVDVVACGENGEDAVRLYDAHEPDVLLMDIQMPGMDGLAAAERILTARPSARIVFLTTFSDDEYIVRALRLGARGYLIKQEVATIAPALRSVMSGQNVLGEEVVGRVGKLMGSHAASTGQRGAQSDGLLTEREQAVVSLVAEGLDNKEIAAQLYLSDGTVRNHISTILQKLGCKKRTQLAVWYYRGA